MPIFIISRRYTVNPQITRLIHLHITPFKSNSDKRPILGGTPITIPMYLVIITQKLMFRTSFHSLLPFKLLFTQFTAVTPLMIPLEGNIFVP